MDWALEGRQVSKQRWKKTAAAVQTPPPPPPPTPPPSLLSPGPSVFMRRGKKECWSLLRPFSLESRGMWLALYCSLTCRQNVWLFLFYSSCMWMIVNAERPLVYFNKVLLASLSFDLNWPANVIIGVVSLFLISINICTLSNYPLYPTFCTYVRVMVCLCACACVHMCVRVCLCLRYNGQTTNL